MFDTPLGGASCQLSHSSPPLAVLCATSKWANRASQGPGGLGQLLLVAPPPQSQVITASATRCSPIFASAMHHCDDGGQ
eukprot:6779214-Prymnesium_polylepis.2